jgi:sec-independent protein translocase protein TatA
MGAFSIWHWVIVLVVVLVLFGGKGKISNLMGDFGKGLKSFKKNIKDEGASAEPAATQSIASDDAEALKSEPAAAGKDQTANN